MYKLIRLMRLVKVFKLLKNKEQLTAQFSKTLQIDSGTERLAISGIMFALAFHVFGCIYFLVGDFQEDSQAWVTPEISDMPPFEQYIMSIYFCITTMTTVGYGDISPNTTVEMVFGISIMVIGVLVFTFISGSLSSII